LYKGSGRRRGGNTVGHYHYGAMSSLLLTFFPLELRIHEHTERGDNDSIKMANNNTNMGGVKCCSER
jgi:hypothetical protein